MNAIYYIGCKQSETHWHKTTAKTLSGAKRLASARYNASAGSEIEVGVTYDGSHGIETVAIKYGFAKWQDA